MNAKKFPILLTDEFFLFPQCSDLLFIENNQHKKNILVQAWEKNKGGLLIVPNLSQNWSERNSQSSGDLTGKKKYPVGILARIVLDISASADPKVVFNSLREVELQGLARVKITSWKHEVEIDWGEYEILTEKKLSAEKKNDLAEKIVRHLPNILEKTKIINEKLPHLTILEENISHFIDLVAQKSKEIDNLIKWKILVSADLEERLELLIKLPSKRQVEKEIDNEAKARIKSHQEKYILLEKLRIIKEKLKQLGGAKDKTQKILERLEKEPYPEYVKKVVQEEIKNYELMPSNSSEASMTKQYIDWVMNVPWWQKTQEINDLNFARQKLDANHYGLSEIKKIIIEHLAVQQRLANKSLGQIICLVGPPGVGKTSLATSIAEATGRNFVSISVGGIYDTAEIQGHRRTYIGSVPGRIIQAMKKAQVTNPLFLIDEIDKISHDFRGDPAYALLAALDPNQNKKFIDNYLGEEVPYNLSEVMFICTANEERDLPSPLLDRMEIVYLSSYSPVEKFYIAKEHLVPENLKKYNISHEELTFEDSAIWDIMEYYTREKGVRELNRKLQKIIRKFVLELVEGKKEKLVVTPKNLKDYLEKKKYLPTQKRKHFQPGTAIGLAYTGYGGDILPIEVVYYPKKEGEPDFTGNLGDIMKESCRVAISYLRSKAKNKEFGLNPEIFSKSSIHIHAPEAGVPKEGPSAGIALTSAIISALTGQIIPNDIGMTGEITLHGYVEAIGGLKEKAIAARRSGKLKTIIIPEGNQEDIGDIPADVRQKLKIIKVKKYEDVWKILFSQEREKLSPVSLKPSFLAKKNPVTTHSD